MVKSTNSLLLDTEGNPVKAAKTFRPMLFHDSAELTFAFDGSLLAGETVVVLEDFVQDGKVVAIHADIDDEGQSVQLVRIGTTATDGSDGEKYVSGDAAAIEDEVAYEGLVPGQSYELRATLMDADTGKAVQLAGSLILTEDVTAEAEFTAEGADGEATVTLERDASDLGGRRLVVFEELYDADGELVAVHKDIEDEGQSVSVAEIGTTLTDESDGDHIVTAGKVDLVDTVAYEGLVPGETYVVRGTLMSKSTGEALTSGGKAVVANAAFQAEASEGTVDVTFTFDTGDLAEGELLVAFEQLLSAEGNVVAVHEDIDDEAQTVVIDNPDTPETPEAPSAAYDKTGVQLPDEACVPAACGFCAVCLAAAAVLIVCCRHQGGDA